MDDAAAADHTGDDDGMGSNYYLYVVVQYVA